MTPEDVSRIEKAGQVVLPWGIYRNEKIQDVRSSYLKWLSVNSYDKKIAEAADIEWRFREEYDEHS